MQRRLAAAGRGRRRRRQRKAVAALVAEGWSRQEAGAESRGTRQQHARGRRQEQKAAGGSLRELAKTGSRCKG
jgi:hypothetical protein